jgi:hypothetical protein
MRAAASIVFIAGSAVIAIALARTPTVAKGSVMEAELLELIRPQGVIGVACDPRIPIGRDGAAFRCTATLADRRTQLLDCQLDRNSTLRWNPVSAPTPAAIPASGDPWSN